MLITFAHNEHCGGGQTIGYVHARKVKFSTKNILFAAVISNTSKACVAKCYTSNAEPEWGGPTVGNKYAKIFDAVSLLQFLP